MPEGQFKVIHCGGGVFILSLPKILNLSFCVAHPVLVILPLRLKVVKFHLQL